jgi:hypothetical protein
MQNHKNKTTNQGSYDVTLTHKQFVFFNVSLMLVLSSCATTLSSTIQTASSTETASSTTLSSYLDATSAASINSSVSEDQSSQSISSSQTESSITQNEDAFRYLAQDWSLSIVNNSPIPLEASQYYTQPASEGAITIGMTDAIGFSDNQHGGRMIRSLNTYYPNTGIEGLAYNGSIINNPNFYDEPDYTKQGLYVDLEDQQVTFNLYTLALFVEAHKESLGPKFFMSASTSGVTFTESQLSYETWAAAAWRYVESKDLVQTPVALHSYQIARWLDRYASTYNTLYLAALENDYIDDQRQAISCRDDAPEENETLICGGETDAIIRTGYGLEHSLFVGNYNPLLNKIQGLALGRYLDHTIYSFENGVDDSNSHTVPTVTAFLASLVSLRRQENLPELTTAEWKQIILQSADLIEPNYLSEINDQGTIVLTPLGQTVHILNKDAAQACALSLACLTH